MMPSMTIALGLGATMLVKNPTLMQQPWMHAKLGAVFLLLGYHARASWTRKTYAAGEYVSRKTAAANIFSLKWLRLYSRNLCNSRPAVRG